LFLCLRPNSCAEAVPVDSSSSNNIATQNLILKIG
jgi:hypothetical protein